MKIITKYEVNNVICEEISFDNLTNVCNLFRQDYKPKLAENTSRLQNSNTYWGFISLLLVYNSLFYKKVQNILSAQFL